MSRILLAGFLGASNVSAFTATEVQALIQDGLVNLALPHWPLCFLQCKLHLSCYSSCLHTTPPKIPSKWSARVNQSISLNGVPMASSSGFHDPPVLPVYGVDSDERRMLTLSNEEFPFCAPEFVGTDGCWLNSTVYATDTQYLEVMGSKYKMAQSAGGYYNFFNWLPLALDGGVVTWHGEEVRKWSIHVPNVLMELLVREDGTPVNMIQNMTVPYYGHIYQTLDFVDFVAGESLEQHWAIFDPADFQAPLLCNAPDPPVTVKVSMYIFHPKNKFNISQQDLGDLVGDTVFVCGDMILNQTISGDHDYEWLTQWDIELFSRWGQYLNTNGYDPPTSIGENNFWVGRETADYQGGAPVQERQCGPSNPRTGMWYSLPEGGRCTDTAPDGSVCTWRATRVKTIDSSCLMGSQGFQAACIKDGRAPFTTAQSIFTGAFASEDQSAGGCPSISESLVMV